MSGTASPMRARALGFGIFLGGAALLTAHAALGADDVAGVKPPKLEEVFDFIRWGGVFLSLFVIAGAAVLLRILEATVDRTSRRFTNRRLLIQKVASFARFFIYFLATALTLGFSFQLSPPVLALIGGTLAVAIGFALRDLVAAVIAGVTIMFDQPFQVGDRVNYAGEYGDIVRIGLRSVRMQTLNDDIVTIPNNKILTDVTASGNYGELMMQLSIRFYVSVEADLETAERLILEGLLTSRYVYLDRPATVVMKQVLQKDFVAVELTGKAYVLDVKYEKAMETDVTKRVLLAFRRHGVAAAGAERRRLRSGPGRRSDEEAPPDPLPEVAR